MGVLSREIQTIKRNQVEISELKNIISEIVNSLGGFNSRMEMTQEKMVNSATRAESNSTNRDHVAPSLKHLLSDSLHKKFADPWSKHTN